MTEQDKKLLLKDICARLPYGVIVKENDGVNENDNKLLDIDMFDGCINYDYIIEDIKPYLRPMSSMTDDERDNLQSLHDIISDENYGDGYSPGAWSAITEWEDYCNARHLDYHGLIEKDLAIIAPEGMYETE